MLDGIEDEEVKNVVKDEVFGSGTTVGADEGHTDIEHKGGYEAAKKAFDRIRKLLGIPESAVRKGPQDKNGKGEYQEFTTRGGVKFRARVYSRAGGPTLDVVIPKPGRKRPPTIKKRFGAREALNGIGALHRGR